MRFEFDTSDLSSRDVLILTAIAAALALPANRALEATVSHNGASGTAASPSPSEATGESLATTGASTDQGEDAPASVKAQRTRRTKAQIEADNLAAEAAARDATQGKSTLTQGQQDAVDDTADILTKDQTSAISGAVAGTADAAVSLTTEQVAKIVDLDGLRTALQTYTGKHDLAAGIALLATFECKRISDVLALPAARQESFLLACHV